MSAFSRRKIVIPKECWNQDWEGKSVLADEEERRLLQFQKKMTELLKDIPNQEATPEKMAWMSYWARSYAISGAVWSALAGESRLMLTVLERMSSEADLQIRLIMEPLSEGGYKKEDNCDDKPIAAATSEKKLPLQKSLPFTNQLFFSHSPIKL